MVRQAETSIYTKTLFVISLGASALIHSCTPSLQGEYGDPEARSEMLDDRWNEDDAKFTTRRLILQMLYENWQAVENSPATGKIDRAWLSNYKKAHGGKNPGIIFRVIENATSEHLNTEAMNEIIRDDLINSQKVRFIDAKQRQDIASEMHYQNESGMVAPETAKKIGRQVGADFFLSGRISSQEHQQDSKKRVSYMTNLVLTDLETGEYAWSGKADLKKNFKRSGLGW